MSAELMQRVAKRRKGLRSFEYRVARISPRDIPTRFSAFPLGYRVTFQFKGAEPPKAIFPVTTRGIFEVGDIIRFLGRPSSRSTWIAVSPDPQIEVIERGSSRAVTQEIEVYLVSLSEEKGGADSRYRTHVRPDLVFPSSVLVGELGEAVVGGDVMARLEVEGAHGDWCVVRRILEVIDPLEAGRRET